MAIVSALSSKRTGMMRYSWAIGSVIWSSTLGRDRRVGQVDHLHAHLLGQRLGQLLVGDQAHLLGDLAEHLAGLLLLLLQQHLQLVVVDEAQVDQNLTDAPNRHDVVLCRL